jgi:hypothetical protein
VGRLELADVYQHQYEASSPEKYPVIKELFASWASEKTSKAPTPGP